MSKCLGHFDGRAAESVEVWKVWKGWSCGGVESVEGGRWSCGKCGGWKVECGVVEVWKVWRVEGGVVEGGGFGGARFDFVTMLTKSAVFLDTILKDASSLSISVSLFLFLDFLMNFNARLSSVWNLVKSLSAISAGTIR